MPAPGDQHGTVANPFEEPQRRMSEYTAQEIATLQSRLEKQLGPEYISARAGPSGQKVHYIAAEKCIALANEVFGFNGWSSSIQNIQVDFVDEHPQTMKISLGLSVIVRVTLRDGTFHEDIGYGHIENCKGKAAAFEKAKKEGTTDALKRALRNFGNVLGNCIYDKDYLSKVTKMKVAPTKFNETELHRHSDFTIKKEEEKAAPPPPPPPPVKLETAESIEDLLEDFDEADFAVVESDHPDEVVLPTVANGASNDSPAGVTPAPVPQRMQAPSRQMGRSTSTGNLRAPQTPNQAQSRQVPPIGYGNRPQAPNQPRAPTNPSAPSAPSAPPANGNMTTPGQAGNAAEPIGFFSARAVQQIPESALQANNTDTPLLLPAGQQAFNPKAESPSIRKTPGIDHSVSKPLSRSGQHVPPTSSQQTSTSGFTPVKMSNAGPGPGGATVAQHLQLSQSRRIGAPGGAGSPLANRGSYRPPTMKRPLQQDSAGRPALADVSTNGATGNAPGVQGFDPKRQKMA